MKKLFTILGVVFAVIIAIIIIAAAIFIPRTLKLDHEATAYIQDAVPKIVTNWNSQELIDRATPELMAAAKSRDEIDRLFAMFRRLGSFKHIDKPEGKVVSSAFVGRGTATVGSYSVRAKFEKGPATIQIQLQRANGTWKINGFRINSDVFLPAKASYEGSSCRT
jgi:hypothetical protein